MTLSRRLRIFYLVVIELAQKYTRALAVGFLAGLVISLGAFRLYPVIMQWWFVPVDRIGLVGEFTPTTLPISIQKHISQGLTDIAKDGSPVPALAQSWETTDSGKIFTFHLRTDAVWHNGKPVKAQDINYNIKDVNFAALDDKTLRVTLNNPYSPFPSLVAKPLFQVGLRGFGPYRLSSIRLNANTVTSMKLVPVDRNARDIRAKEYRFYRTEAAAILAYKLGEIDELQDMTAMGDLNDWRGSNVIKEIRRNRIVGLFFNLNDGFLKDKGVRQALAYGVPNLSEEEAISPLSSDSWAYTDKVKKYTYDITQAKRLLGSDQGSTSSATLTISTFAPYEAVAETIAQSWESLNIPTDVRIVSSVPTDYQVLLSVQDLPPDPDQYPFWHSTQPTNKTGYVNVKIDKLLEDGRQELDPEKRKTIYADFQRRLVEDVPVAFLYYQPMYTIRRK
jgi:peptide/nickel transport system substrate-binding protein